MGHAVGARCFRVCDLLVGSDSFRFRIGRPVGVFIDGHVNGTHGIRLVWKQRSNYPTQKFLVGRWNCCFAPQLCHYRLERPTPWIFINHDGKLLPCPKLAILNGSFESPSCLKVSFFSWPLLCGSVCPRMYACVCVCKYASEYILYLCVAFLFRLLKMYDIFHNWNSYSTTLSLTRISIVVCIISIDIDEMCIRKMCLRLRNCISVRSLENSQFLSFLIEPIRIPRIICRTSYNFFLCWFHFSSLPNPIGQRTEIIF